MKHCRWFGFQVSNFKLLGLTLGDPSLVTGFDLFWGYRETVVLVGVCGQRPLRRGFQFFLIGDNGVYRGGSFAIDRL